MLRGSGQQSSNAGRTFAKTGVLAYSLIMIATMIGFVVCLAIPLLPTKHADAGTQEIYL